MFFDINFEWTLITYNLADCRDYEDLCGMNEFCYRGRCLAIDDERYPSNRDAEKLEELFSDYDSKAPIRIHKYDITNDDYEKGEEPSYIDDDYEELDQDEAGDNLQDKFDFNSAPSENEELAQDLLDDLDTNEADLKSI